MDIQLIQKLLKAMDSSTVSLMEIEENNTRIRLEKSTPVAAPQPQVVMMPQSVAPAAPVTMTTATTAPQPENQTPPAEKKEEIATAAPTAQGKEIKSPLVGTFHALSGKAKTVGVGAKLKKGDAVCIIEAMKLMNEICMEEDGEILWVSAKEGDLVEYGQVLFQYQ